MQQALDFTAPPPRHLAMAKPVLLPGADELPAGALHGQFLAFHRENPQVYWELRRLALELQTAGRRKYGLKGLFEVLRWKHALSTHGEAFKLNNNYTAYYARLLMQHEQELAGFFETREQRDD